MNDFESSVKSQGSSVHTPVLLNEVLEYLDPQPGEVVADGTTDGGGHLEAMMEKMAYRGTMVAIDLDEAILNRTRARLEPKYGSRDSNLRLVWANASYADLSTVLQNAGIGKIDKLLLDLGFSSEQLIAGRGFAYKPESSGEPLDMRYDRNASGTAADLLNALKEEELADIFWKFGEERFSRRIAKQIVMRRQEKKLVTVGDLVECVKRAVPGYFRKGERDVIARSFQAARIAVNGELDSLGSILANLPQLVSPGGRAAIISFHSLEDRMVKNAFRQMEKEEVGKILTKKPIGPTEEEVRNNPRARSAKLRVISMKK